MIINRRRALASITAAAFGRIAWCERRRDQAAIISNPGRTGSEGGNADRQTRTPNTEDLSLIGAHVYSEEGIPMFLGCENTAVVGVSPQGCGGTSDLNQKVSSAFERYARQWVHHYPHAGADDAAKVVEFLAARDFTSGGLEASL